MLDFLLLQCKLLHSYVQDNVRIAHPVKFFSFNAETWRTLAVAASDWATLIIVDVSPMPDLNDVDD